MLNLIYLIILIVIVIGGYLYIARDIETFDPCLSRLGQSFGGKHPRSLCRYIDQNQAAKLNCCQTTDDFNRAWSWKHQDFNPVRKTSENRIPRPFVLCTSARKRLIHPNFLEKSYIKKVDDNYPNRPLWGTSPPTHVGLTFPDQITKNELAKTIYQGYLTS